MKHFPSVLLGLFLACLPVFGFEASYHFEEKDATILDSGSGAWHGLYYPSADKDNDNPETTNPARYRKDGLVGKGLCFFDSYQSYATLPCPWMKAGLENFYLSLAVKRGKRSIQYLIGNKYDSGKDGFSLMLWGSEWRIGLGDGQNAEVLKIPRRTKNESWVTLGFAFEKGKITFRENGVVTFETEISLKKIISKASVLTLGNYCSSNKKAYAADCILDELLLSDSPAGLLKAAELAIANLPRIKACCLPVDGAEHHFQNRKTLHTFREAPVGATFALYFDHASQAELVLKLPDGVRLSEAFNSNHNTPDLCFPIRETAKGEFHVTGLRSTELASETISCMFEVAQDFTEGEIQWTATDKGKISHQDHFTLKVIPLPPALPAGNFYAFCYTNQDIAFFDSAIFRRTAGLFAHNGITGKGRFYRRLERRAALDEILLKDFGFQLFEISLWGGPQNGLEDCPVPRAIGPDGKEQKTACLRTLVNDPKTLAAYQASVKEQVFTEGTVGAVLDFEPWGRPRRECFCPRCIEDFRHAQNLPEGITPQDILRQHLPAWSQYWIHTTALYMQMMADAFRKAGPDIPIWDYTYHFPYENPDKMAERFRNIPKDPRVNENFLEGSILSLYHINGREAFDACRSSRKALKKKVSGINLISRHDLVCGHYTTLEETLSPDQIYQKAVMSGALGHPWFGIYPGHWLDGSMHSALNKAIRDVRLHENFYLKGQDVTEATAVKASGTPKDSAWLIHRAGNQSLATLFNFSRQPVSFSSPLFPSATVPPDGVVFLEF